MKYIKKYCYLILSVLFIISLGFSSFISTNKTFSKIEKRYLTQFPIFTIDILLSGKYRTEFEAYFSDQFPLRDFWINIYQHVQEIVIKNK